MPILSPSRATRHTLCIGLLCGMALWGCEGELERDISREDAGDMSPASSLDMSPTTSLDMPVVRPDGGMTIPDEDMPGTTLPDGGMVTSPDCVEDMYTRMTPSCAGCHGESGGWRGFASLNSFKSLLVYNPRWVEPGAPEQSALIPMLQGRGQGALAQMPLGSQSFADLEAAGQTQITLAEIESCITQLTPGHTIEERPRATIRFKSAQQMLNALYDQLGLTPQDFFGLNDKGVYDSVRQDRYPILNPDVLPTLDARQRGYSGIADPFARWENLGGGHYLDKRARRVGPTISQGLNLTQISQAWCRLAIQKSGNDAILRHVTLSDTSAQAADAIKDNIGYLHLRMLGAPATDQDTQDLYDAIYLPYEQSEGGTETAWTAVCATLIRDPLWMTY